MKQVTGTPLEKLVLLVLADCHNEATGRCFPSINFICDRAMCSRQGAMKVLHSLEEQGLILARKSPGKSTHYQLLTSQQSVPVGVENGPESASPTGQLSVPVNRVYPSTECTGPVNSVDHTGQLSLPEPGNNQEVTGNTTRPDSKSGPPVCPHKAILEIYHQELPALRRVRTWTETRESHLRSRWRENPERQDLDWWRKFFRYIGRSDFLMGRSDPAPGRPAFQADLEWILRPMNFTKIIEGKYHR